jgi:hypothetical protein
VAPLAGDRAVEQVGQDDAVPGGAQTVGRGAFDLSQPEHRVEHGDRDRFSRIVAHRSGPTCATRGLASTRLRFQPARPSRASLIES